MSGVDGMAVGMSFLALGVFGLVGVWARWPYAMRDLRGQSQREMKFRMLGKAVLS